MASLVLNERVKLQDKTPTTINDLLYLLSQARVEVLIISKRCQIE